MHIFVVGATKITVLLRSEFRGTTLVAVVRFLGTTTPTMEKPFHTQLLLCLNPYTMDCISIHVTYTNLVPVASIYNCAKQEFVLLYILFQY